MSPNCHPTHLNDTIHVNAIISCNIVIYTSQNWTMLVIGSKCIKRIEDIGSKTVRYESALRFILKMLYESHSLKFSICDSHHWE